MARAYEEQANAILGDKTLDPWYKKMLLKKLDEEFGTAAPASSAKPASAPGPGPAPVPKPDTGSAFLHGLTAGAVGGAVSSAGGMSGIAGAGKPAAQPITNGNAARNFFAVEHGFEPLSPFAQGLGTGVAGGIAGVATTGKPAQQEPFVQGLATGAAGGPAESITAGKPADQGVTNDNAARNFFAVEHGFEPLSPFEQGLQGTNDGNTPSPTPSPMPTPTQTPSVVEPMPGPGPLTDPADMPYGGTYEEQSRAIAGSGMDPWEQRDKQGQLDIVFGKSKPAAKVQTQLEIDNATKLKEKTDRINGLYDQANFYEIKGYSDEANNYRSEADRLKGEFGANLQGLDGYELDPKEIVDVKLNNKDIGNVRYENGVATGNLDDIVTGFGGKIEWNGQKNATIYDADGKVVSKILNTAQGLMECDKYGRVVKKCGTRGGSVQADIAEYAEKMGVPVSKFHDKNGVLHLYAQPDMKDSSVKMVRDEKDVTIYVYVDYKGKYADQIHPATIQYDANGNAIPNSGMTYAELTALGMKERYKDGQTFNIGGKIEVLDSNGPLVDKDGRHYRLDYADPNDTVMVHVKIFSNNPSGSSVWEKPDNANQKMGKTELIDQQGNFSSHVMTFDVLGFWENIKSGNVTWGEIAEAVRELPKNYKDMLDSGQVERLFYNWSLDDPGTAYIYPYLTAEEQKGTSAHENVHRLGVSDPYGSIQYRGGERSPYEIELDDTYGQKRIFEVKDNDLMMCNGGTDFSETDLVMMMKAFETGGPQYFPKGDDSMTENIRKYRELAILYYLLKGKIKPFG